MSTAADYADPSLPLSSYELMPTEFPRTCISAASDSLDDGSTPSPSQLKALANVQYLYENQIIAWPNFTQCLPNCGLCTTFQSDHTYIIYNLVIIGILLPCISFGGLIGNALSAFVYSRPGMRSSSTNLYLCALGCSDIAVIVTAIFLFFVDNVRRYSLTLSRIYGRASPFIYPAGMIAQTCSVYFTLVAGVDCFVKVCLPVRLSRLLSQTCVVKFLIGSVLLFSLLYNVPHCFEAVLLDCFHVRFNAPSVEVCPAPFRFNPTYTLVYYKYLYSVFLAVGPLVVLIVLNSCIIVTSMVLRRGEGSAEDNVALILVVLLFISCNTVALLINIFESTLSTLLEWRINYIIDISNLLVVFNSSFNFVIYYRFSTPFRSTFLHYFFERKLQGNSSTRDAYTSKAISAPQNHQSLPMNNGDNAAAQRASLVVVMNNCDVMGSANSATPNDHLHQSSLVMSHV